MIEPGRPARTWQLDPGRSDELVRLSGVLARRAPSAAWHSSDEPKAVATAHRLTDGPVTTWAELQEARRSDWFETHQEFRAAVREAFAAPARSARPGWEPLAATRDRIGAVVGDLLGRSGGVDLVLVGHGTAWTLLVSELTGHLPDLAAWDTLRTPDLCTLDVMTGTVTDPWGSW